MVRVTRGSFDQLCVLSLYCSISMASNGEALAGVAAGRQGSPDAEIANLARHRWPTTPADCARRWLGWRGCVAGYFYHLW